MSYFRQLPDLLYASKIRKSGFGEYEQIKNIFRRYKLRDDVKAIANQFYKYEIPLGFTPEQVAADMSRPSPCRQSSNLFAETPRVRWPSLAHHFLGIGS